MKIIFAADIGGTNSRFAYFNINARGGVYITGWMSARTPEIVKINN